MWPFESWLERVHPATKAGSCAEEIPAAMGREGPEDFLLDEGTGNSLLAASPRSGMILEAVNDPMLRPGLRGARLGAP